MALQRLYRRGEGWLLRSGVLASEVPQAQIAHLFAGRTSVQDFVAQHKPTLPYKAADSSDAPVFMQEIWAAGVTYRRSREARVGESASASVYDRVYDAERPQIFFKACPGKAAGSGGWIGLRDDSRWTVPEPELCLVADAQGRMVGYTLGDDVSARDIEGPNPLYQPQAKVFRNSCALGPCVVLNDGSFDPLDWSITMTIQRAGATVFSGSAELRQLKRTPSELLAALFRCQELPDGAVLMTGTGIVPPDEFALSAGDRVAISSPEVGELVSVVRLLSRSGLPGGAD